MLSARSLQKVFAPRCRFSPHSGIGFTGCFAAVPWLLPTCRSYHSGSTTAGGNTHSFPLACEALRVRTADATAGPRAVADAPPLQAADALAAARSAAAAAGCDADKAQAVADDAHTDAKRAEEQMLQAKSRMDEAAKDLDDARVAAAHQPKDEILAAVVEKRRAQFTDCVAAVEAHAAVVMDRVAWLNFRVAELGYCVAELNCCVADRNFIAGWLKDAEAGFKVPSTFPRIAQDVALQQLGALVRFKRFEVPTETLEMLERHVHTLRGLFLRPVDKSNVPNLAVAATPGAGKTTLLRYLQQAADTVRYGAELQSNTNWLAKGWGAQRADVEDAVPSVPALRHVFVGFATFKGEESCDASFFDTEATIECRCAWRILYDAGLAPKRPRNLDLNFTQAAKALRAMISTANSCDPDEVAIVFLLDEVTNIPEGPRRVLLGALAAWQQQDLAEGRPSVFVVAGESLFELGEQWVKCSRPIAALPLPPLVKLPHELAADVVNDVRLDQSRRWELIAYISAAGGHPSTLERAAQAMMDLKDER